MTTDEKLIETVARIIDPDAWAYFDTDAGQHNTTDLLRFSAWKQSSRRKAQSILQALSTGPAHDAGLIEARARVGAYLRSAGDGRPHTFRLAEVFDPTYAGRFPAAEVAFIADLRLILQALAGEGGTTLGDEPSLRVLTEIGAERKRQIEVEGWTPAHDDEHNYDALANAAGAYAVFGSPRTGSLAEPPSFWPWSRSWWKPTSRRRSLIKAGALIVAAIERLDRAGGGE